MGIVVVVIRNSTAAKKMSCGVSTPYPQAPAPYKKWISILTKRKFSQSFNYFSQRCSYTVMSIELRIVSGQVFGGLHDVGF